MKKRYFILLCLIMALGCHNNLDAQGLLKRLKNKVTKSVKDSIRKKKSELENKVLQKADLSSTLKTSKNNIEKSANSITGCKNSGSEIISKGHKAYVQYRSIEKKIETAERYAKNNNWNMVNDQLDMAANPMKALLKKAPNADISKLCKRIADLKRENTSGASDTQDINTLISFFNRYHGQKMPGDQHIANPDRYNFLNNGGDFLKIALNFNRTELLQSLKSSTNPRAKRLEEILLDYPDFINREKIPAFLMSRLDSANNDAGLDLSATAKRIKEVAEGLLNIAGSNQGLQDVINFSNKQLAKAEQAMASVYTSEFHKDNVGKVILTKKTFTPGNESSVEINPKFVSGDQIIGTIYLPASIEDAVGSWNQSTGSGNLEIVLEDDAFNRLNGPYDTGLTATNADYTVKIAPETPKSQSWIQFVLLPNLNSNIKKDIVNRNITPIFTADWMALQPERNKKWNVIVKAKGPKTKSQTYKGEFYIDLSKNEGANYYKKAANKMMDNFIADTPLPSAAYRDSGLESQLLNIMSAKNWDEKFEKTYPQTKWRWVKPIGVEPWQEMDATFTYRKDDGSCGYHTYTFRKYGSKQPQSWGAAKLKVRLSCSKL